MYKILFFVLVFIVLVPIVWRIVNRLFFKVTGELSEEPTASETIEKFISQKRKIEDRQKSLENDIERNKKEIDKLNDFSNNETKE